MLEKTTKITCSRCGLTKGSDGFTMYEKDQEITCDPCCRIIQYKALSALEKQDTNPTKICKACAESKPLTDFYDRKEAKDGKHSNCKACMIAAKANRAA